MTHAQETAELCGIVPELHDARFVSQHLAAYAFTRRLAGGKRVLEVGFGEGYGTNYLAETAREIIGVDVAPGNIPRAQAKYRRANLRFLHMQGMKLSFPDASFDLVGSFQVIEHIPEPHLPTFLTEIRRVLVSDGICVLSTLNLEHNMKPGRPYEKLPYHEKEFTAPELRELLERFFPSVELHGLYCSRAHTVCHRLKKWGLMRIGPRTLNPLARFFEQMSVDAYQTRPVVTRAALDLIAVCRKT